MPGVNPKRIGIIGHGLGGQNALLTAAFDYRISATVTSCGFTTFPRYKGGSLADWASPRMMPRIHGVYHDNPTKIPFDFAEILATLAPRPVFVIAPVDDPVMNVDGVRGAVTSATAVYQLRRVSGALKVTYPTGAREFPADTRNSVYAWLGQRLSARAGMFRNIGN
jgi:predicted dienelactone hydrolase